MGEARQITTGEYSYEGISSYWPSAAVALEGMKKIAGIYPTEHMSLSCLLCVCEVWSQRLLQAIADVRDASRLPRPLRRRSTGPRHPTTPSSSPPARCPAHRPVLSSSRQSVRLQQDHVVRRDI